MVLDNRLPQKWSDLIRFNLVWVAIAQDFRGKQGQLTFWRAGQIQEALKDFQCVSVSEALTSVSQ